VPNFISEEQIEKAAVALLVRELGYSSLDCRTAAAEDPADRSDLVLYINGLPLVWIELKNSNVNLKVAYDDNFLNYRKDVPPLFVYSGLCVLSNAIATRITSSSSCATSRR
jgi:type I site-specific restriction-modification system R (restriction) subunit